MPNREQQQLFDHYNPLEERLGREFFDGLPKKPGVYKMYGERQRLLYVGKAKDLRNRLFTYRRANTGSVSRKTIRLIRMVHRIELELCATEKEALLLENDLIRTERPEFNRAKKSPETYYFIYLKVDEEEGEAVFRLNMREPNDDDGTWSAFGAFKGHALVRRALGALLRLLYIAEHRIDSPHLLPPVLLKNLTPLHYRLPLGDPPLFERDLPVSLLSGTSEFFFEAMTERLQEEGLLDRYVGKLILEDMEAVRQFYEKCSRRNNEIMQRFALESPIIPQEKLDDYLIEIALS